MRECLAQTPAAEVSILASLRRGQSEQATLLGTLGQLYTLGYPLDWLALYRPDEAGSMPQFVRLPGPWTK
jgi:acyl transferase domain-containing protein